MYYSILNDRFDSTLLIDSTLNKPFDPENDIFYKPLLNDIDNEKLFYSVVHIRDNKISLNNLSHVTYLLPWSLQQSLNSHNFFRSVDPSEKDDGRLKINLTNYIEGVKKSSLISSCLLKLRFIGFCNRRDLIYRRLRDVYQNNYMIRVICRINNKVVEREGKVLFFDVDLNLLLMNHSIIYIKLV